MIRFRFLKYLCYGLAVSWVLNCQHIYGESKLDFFGYLENRFFLINQTDVSWDHFKEKILLGDYNRLRLNIQASPSEKVTVYASVDFFSFHGVMTGELGTYDETSGSSIESDDTRIDLDRAYVNLYFKKLDLTIGKQRIAMGVSYVWAPLDVFNRVNLLEPKEEKPGANAIKLYMPLSKRSALTAVFSPDDQFDTSQSGLRFQTQLGNIDIGTTFIYDGENRHSLYGLDFRGENGVGWWLETVFFDSENDDFTRLAIGMDYTFPIKNGLYWLNEFYYDSSGESDPHNYDYNLILTGKRSTLGRTYLFSLLRYSIDEFLSVSCSCIFNLDDGSGTVYPSIAYDLSQNVNLSAGFYFPLGKEGREFNITKKSLFFIWLKINF